MSSLLRGAVLATVAALLIAAPADAAQKLKLHYVKGLPGKLEAPVRPGLEGARDLAIGPGNEVWVTGDLAGQYVARISPKGKLKGVYHVGGSPDSITRGPDGAMWFTMRDGNAVGRITRSGALR